VTEENGPTIFKIPFFAAVIYDFSFLIYSFKIHFVFKTYIGFSGWLLAMELLSISHILRIYLCKGFLNEGRIIPTLQVVQLLYLLCPIAVLV